MTTRYLARNDDDDGEQLAVYKRYPSGSNQIILRAEVLSI